MALWGFQRDMHASMFAVTSVTILKGQRQPKYPATDE